MVNENQLLESQNVREGFITRVEVLEQVKELILLPNTEYATVEQLAEYFNVPERTVSDNINRHKDELISDGGRVYKLNEVKKILNTDNSYLENGLKIPNRGLRLFPKRAILRIAMLLRDGEIAKEIRTRLLDIVQDVSSGKDNVIENVVNEITEEKQLIMQRVEAEMDGNYDKVCEINAKLFALKNRRIKELETEVDTITTNSLTIIESKKVINRLIRVISIKNYNSLFGKAWGDLYTKLNYQLGINIKARDKKKSESYLDTLNEREIFETEKIVRTWANSLHIEVEKELKLA